MWTGMEIRGRRVPDSDRIPPSPPPHQVSTNTRSANTKLIKFVLNLRYDTFILTQRGGGNWSQFRVLGATIVCCHFIFCSAIIVPVILAKAGVWGLAIIRETHFPDPGLMFPIIYHVNRLHPRYHYIFHCILFSARIILKPSSSHLLVRFSQSPR